MTTLQKPTSELTHKAAAPVAFDPDRSPTCEDIERIALGSASADFSDNARTAIEYSHQTLAAAHARGNEIYGLTTGFGPHVQFEADTDAFAQGSGLIAHLGAGCGPYASRENVRAILAVRCQALSLGASGIAPRAAEALLALLRADVCPAIPEIGSVGASGDLIPLAHAARVITGEGCVLTDSHDIGPAHKALKRAGLEPLGLSGRDALAMVNGTSFMTAYACRAIARADRLIEVAEALTAWTFRSLRGRHEALDDRIHQARGHAGQIASAASIHRHLGAHSEDRARPLQEVYSLRCAPQILGACRDQLRYARSVIETELAGVNDNPVVCGTPDNPAVLHGGNFQGQQVAFAADALNAALTQTALLIERQLDVVLNPELNGGAPLLLAWAPGATSGMAGAQITATAVAADIRRNATPSAIATMPTNGRNQDVVSMGAMAARVAFEQTDRVASVLAIHQMALDQLAFLQRHGRAPGSPVRRPEWAPDFEGFTEDRALHNDISRIATALIDPTVL
ncbi:MAG: aromatic amino acid ammonia-lyase [Planctomycetota bacterium]